MDVDPNLAAEQAAQKWGPDLSRALWLIENEFPGCGWCIARQASPGLAPYAFEASIRCPPNDTYKFGRRFDADCYADPVWALCLAMELAALAGFHKPVPPAPPPPPHGSGP